MRGKKKSKEFKNLLQYKNIRLHFLMVKLVCSHMIADIYEISPRLRAREYFTYIIIKGHLVAIKNSINE